MTRRVRSDGLDPEVDYEEIARLFGQYDFPWDLEQALSFALFSARRVVWASEHRLEPGASYMGAGDPAAEIPGLGTYDREQLLGGALRGFLS